jgi:hypothetical protein
MWIQVLQTLFHLQLYHLSVRLNSKKSSQNARWLTEKLNEQRDVKVSLSGVQKELNNFGYAHTAHKRPNLTAPNESA